MRDDKPGMSLDEFAELDPEEVAAQCGGATPAEDGPNPGIAGEQEAVMADTEETTDPAPSEEPAGRRGAQRASDLLPILRQADPSLDDASALELLQEILNEDRDAGKLPRVIKSSSEYVPAALEPKVRAFVAANGTDDSGADNPAQPAVADGTDSPPFDQDAPGASAPDGDPVDSGETPPASEPEATSVESAVEASGESRLDSYRQALRPLLEASVAARENGTRDEADAAVWRLAEAIFDQGFTLYRELRQSDEEAEKRLFQLRIEEGQTVPLSVTRDEIAANPDLREQVWYYRTAVRSTLRVFEGHETIQELLEDFTWPSESHFRRQQSARSRNHSRSATRTAVPGLPPRPASEEPASSSTDDTPPSEPVTGVANTGAPKELEGPPTQEVPVVRTSEGRRTVSSSDAPEPERHVVRGGGRAAMRPSSKAPAAARQSSDPVEEPDAQQPQADGPADSADRDASRGKRKSDESFLVELPDEVFEAAVKAVIEDPDPEQCWAFRSADAVRAEAERRILVESGRLSAV